MSFKFANRRKPRKIGGNEEDESDDQDSDPVVKRPISSKMRQKSKLRFSLGSGETSMADDSEGGSDVVLPRRHGLGRRAIERSAAQYSASSLESSGRPAIRPGLNQDRPSYTEDYLKELRASTPSTPKSSTDGEKDKTIDVAAKFSEIMKVSVQSAIPSEIEIREKKARRARLAKEQDYILLSESRDDDELALSGDQDAQMGTRLVRDDEDFAEGFDDFVEDGRMSLGRKAEYEQKQRQRMQIQELIDDAEDLSDDDDSDLDEKAAYEATQTRAAMGNGGEIDDHSRVPPKLTPLPRMENCLERLQTMLATTQQSKEQLIARMDELRKEKADIAVREVEIQALIKEAGEKYEKLKREAGITHDAEGPVSAADDINMSRGLESFGAPMIASNTEPNSES